jgi:nucleotide-binding universal stress UspA family protein
MFQRILVPLDESLRAERALPVAARIARATGGSLLLVQVINPPIDYSGGLGLVPLMTEQAIESEMAGATDYLNAVAASPELSGIETRTEVSFGLPAQHLIAAAEAHESDLVVLCSHGRTGFTRWALGSVAHTLVHQSTAPVLVLQESKVAALLARLGSARSLRALVPLDGSPLAEAALNPAATLTAALAAPAQGTLHLVQVVKPVSSPAMEGFVSEFNEETRRLASTYLATVAEGVQAVTGRALALTTSVELASDVASALLSQAEHGGNGQETRGAGGCDLIAMSTHGRSGLERWVMGSVTQRLLNATKLPMLIVRPQHKG